MDAIRAMAEVDCQALTPTGRNTLIGLCREFIRQTEALEALADALDADQPDFQGFGWTALERLDTLIKAMGSSDRDDKISTLLDLDPFVVVICGLSLSTKKIKRMRNDLWSEILRQAQTAAERLRPLILRNDKVTQLVKDSGNENFRQSQAHGPTTCSSFLLVLQLTKPGYEQSRKDHGSAQGQISHIMMHGLPCYSYTVSYSSKFRTLIDLALHRVVAAYLPTVPADACIRLTTQFDESLLQALIGYLPEFYDSQGFDSAMLRSAVVENLGEDVLRAMQSSQTWAEDPPDQPTTRCGKCRVIPGQVIIVDVFIDMSECVTFVNGS